MPTATELGQIQDYKVIYDFHFVWKTQAFDAGEADGGNKPKVKTYLFHSSYRQSRYKSIFLFSWGLSHKSYGYKEMRCSGFKAVPLKDDFVN